MPEKQGIFPTTRDGQWGVALLATIAVTLAVGQCQTAGRFNEAAADRRQLRTEVAAETGRLSTAIDGVRTDGERGRTAIRAEVAAEAGRLFTAIDGVRTDGERGRTAIRTDGERGRAAIRAEVARVGEGVARLEGALGTSPDTARKPMD